jgi:hypothetical protein
VQEQKPTQVQGQHKCKKPTLVRWLAFLAWCKLPGARGAWLTAEGVHFGEDFGGFGFEGVALFGEVVFGVFAGFVLEVEVAEVVVDDFFALAEVVEACFFDYGGQPRLRPEDVGEAEDKQDCGSDDVLEFHDNYQTQNSLLRILENFGGG